MSSGLDVVSNTSEGLAERNETSSHNQNEQVQYVYHCCLCLIFDQTTMAQEQKYLMHLSMLSRWGGGGGRA